MEEKQKKFYITTPIYYPSANFHIGHCYTTIIADAIARYKRLKGYDVFFQTGTDEHGQKIEKKAEEAGVTPKEYVDKIIEDAKDLWKSLDISYDYFIRTTDSDHERRVQKIFKKLYDNGDIYKGEYKGLYCTPCESFWTESQLDENGNCPDCHREVHEVKEEAYFFRLSKYQERLEKFYEENPNFIQPVSRKNEMLNNFIKPGLSDLCVSRTSFKWGIPVDFDDKHVIYVWIDALTNYITSLGYPEDLEKFNKYWPADLHLVGKEIVRFHTIIWPCLLMALDLPLPHQVFGHGWLIINGGKISKSLGNYKDPREYINDYGVDAVRYFALREVPFGSDGNFSEEALINRTNSDLVNTLGNLVNRTLAMSKKYFNSVVTNPKVYENIDDNLTSYIKALPSLVDKKMEGLKINEALEDIFELLKRANKYIDETTPWILAKDETKTDRLKTVIYNLLEVIRISAVLLTPFIPETSEKIFKMLNTKETSFDSINDFGKLEENITLNESFILFNRIDTKTNE
mgnify:FL=1